MAIFPPKSFKFNKLIPTNPKNNVTLQIPSNFRFKLHKLRKKNHNFYPPSTQKRRKQRKSNKEEINTILPPIVPRIRLSVGVQTTNGNRRGTVSGVWRIT